MMGFNQECYITFSNDLTCYEYFYFTLDLFEPPFICCSLENKSSFWILLPYVLFIRHELTIIFLAAGQHTYDQQSLIGLNFLWSTWINAHIGHVGKEITDEKLTIKR